jgi:glucuronoarabinoxylan endo-1,4-beta-xylanase
LASAQTATINFGTTYQTIRGFGTSTAWQPVLNSTQANNLFGTGAGQVGLTILRSRIDPSSTTGGSNWQTELQNAQQAQSINSQVIVFATPWTPPAAWKTNGSVDDGSLNTADYDNFANYLNAFIAYEKAGGVNLYAISVQNEPDYLPDYESCGYTGAQMDAWIAQEGGKINTKLMMPESDSFNLDESDPTLDDSNAVGYVSIVAGHTYGVAPFYYTNAKNKGKDVWMTETTYTPAAGSSAQPTISDAISAAELYHQSMAVAQYNAYVYWWTPLLLNGNSPNYYAYALGQYSKFVRPGYVMVGANNTPASGVYVTAYKGNNNYVIVAVNSNGSSSNITFDLSGATVTSVTPYQTSASNQLAQLSAVSVSNDAFTYSLPAQSITTFVGAGSSGTPSFTLSRSASTLSVTQGSSATDTIAVTDVNGFSGSVSFTATGLPSGVTASFSPTSSTSSSVLTLTASSSAATGSSTVTITGTSGSTTASTTIALTVNAKTTTGFTLAPSASSLSVTQGTSGTDTITVTDIGGFTGSVSFTVSSLPSGVTASFSPTSSTSASVLTLTASSSATVGAYTLTITGTSGSTTATTTIILSVASTGGGSTLTTGVPFTIVNAASGQCVDDSGGSTSNGTRVQQYTCSSGNANQKWVFTSVGNGYYSVATNNNTSAVWNITGSGTAAGTNVQLYGYWSGGTNEQFLPIKQSSGGYEFQDHNSGLCVADPGGSGTAGQQLQIEPCNGSSSVVWKLNEL